jgi:hypothetical protein
MSNYLILSEVAATHRMILYLCNLFYLFCHLEIPGGARFNSIQRLGMFAIAIFTNFPSSARHHFFFQGRNALCHFRIFAHLCLCFTLLVQLSRHRLRDWRVPPNRSTHYAITRATRDAACFDIRRQLLLRCSICHGYTANRRCPKVCRRLLNGQERA